MYTACVKWIYRYEAVSTAREAWKLSNRAAIDAASDVKDLIERINAAPGTIDTISVAKRTEARNRLIMLKKLAAARREVSAAKANELKLILSTNSSDEIANNESIIETSLSDGPVAAWVIGVPVVPSSSRAVGLRPCIFALH